ncbi:Uncharacterised protein [Mycobacteroides abscessus]|nr:Uncharacterised protein [Mycobacteroides abscessus]
MASVAAGEADSFQAAQHGGDLFEYGGDVGVGAGLDGDGVELVVRGQSGVGIVGVQGGGEAGVGVPHRRQVAGGDVGDRLPDGELVHRGGDGLRGTCLADVDGTDDGVPTRLGLHQAGLLQAGQGLADRGPAHSQPSAQLVVTQAFTGGECAVDDGRTQGLVGVIAEQGSRCDALRGRYRHAIYCTSAEGAGQVPGPRRMDTAS